VICQHSLGHQTGVIGRGGTPPNPSLASHEDRTRVCSRGHPLFYEEVEEKVRLAGPQF